ncbi:hypothetical protein FN846DRAFT_915932 [Sphaerosporella brunnea]|uniref:Uncharacterized protein n=1 Tax=Sphaerosporella brunnea TaxID=1250544 RepID=A0A5J5FA62_9PEZI|nr:hypothetical protein FN846DRAFT_915932 [Sphaerosporella brunnea]
MQEPSFRTDADKDFRRIELQSAADLRHIVHKLEAAALQKLNERLPPPPAPSDSSSSERDAVRRLVLDYVHATVSAALPNITINGLPAQALSAYTATTTDEEYEPYDAALQLEITRLHERIEARTLQNARLRRDVPAAVAAGFARVLDDEDRREVRLVRAWERSVDALDVAAALGGGGGGAAAAADVDADAEHELRRARVGLERLKAALPEAAGRLERAAEAADVVVSRRKT